MNIAKLQALIPASFEYKYSDADGVEATESIELKLKRMSFDATASKTFREAIKNEDDTVLKGMLANLIDSWNIDNNGEAFPPTEENIGAAPADFVTQLSECVFAKLNPNPQKPLPSDNGSEPLASSTAVSATA